MNKKHFYFLTAILLFMYSGFVEAQNLKVFGTIPGATPSLHYQCRVKLQSEPETAWRATFVMQSESLNNPSNPAPGQSSTGLDNGFFKDQFGWTTSHIAFESQLNEVVQVEVSLVSGATINKSSLITKAMVKPYGEANYSISNDNKKVIVTFNKHTNVYLDINGQMEDKNTGDGYSDNTNNAKIHTLCIFSNPIYSIPADAAVLTTAWSQSVGNLVKLDDDFYNPKSAQKLEDERVAKNNLKPAGKKFYFGPGVHNISTQFPIRSDEEYYIPGDAIVYGTFLPEANVANIKVIGSGIICGSKGRWGGKYVGVPDEKPSNASENKVFTGKAKNAVLEGFIVLDPVNHSFNLDNNDELNINFENKYTNLKVIGYRKNADGINAFHNSTIKNCFIKTNDDCFYMGFNDMRIENNVTWTDMNGAVMYLARSSPRSYFRNTTCIYTRNSSNSNPKGVIELRDTDNNIENITIENLTVEDPKPSFKLFRFSVDSDSDGDGLTLNNITFKNIRMDGTSASSQLMVFNGKNTSVWKNIKFENCYYQNQCLKPVTDSSLWSINPYLETSTINISCGTTNTLVTSVAVSQATLSLANTNTFQLTATVSPTNATNKNVTWSSSNTAIATVSSTGLVTAIGVGLATITVTTTDGNKTATCNVTVTASNPVCSLPWTNSNIIIITKANNSFTSNLIGIACGSTSINIKMNLAESASLPLTNSDKITVLYKLGNGPETQIIEWQNDFTDLKLINIDVPVSGAATLQIIIRAVTTAPDARYDITNLNVTTVGTKQNQTITFPAITSKVTGTADFNPGATASSGLAVSYTSSNTAVATIVNGNIRVIGAGTSTITASQSGNTTFNAAANVSQTLTVTTSAPAANVTVLTPWVSGTTHNKVSGSNRLLVVMVMGEHNSDFSAATVTYGNQEMTKQAERMYAEGTSSRTYASIYTLNEVGVNAATSGAISVSYNGIATGGSPSGGSSIYSVLLGNVNQTTPVIGAVANSLSGTSITTSALSSSSGDLLLYSGATAANTDASPNNGFTETFESNTTWGDGVGGSKLSTGVSEIPQFSQSASGRMVLCALVVKKSSGSPTARIGQSQATLSVEENLQTGTTLKVYPNPVSSILTIESVSNSEKEITVINTLGQVIFKTKSKSTSTQLDMQSLNVSGLVLVQVIEEGKVSTHKVIVK